MSRRSFFIVILLASFLTGCNLISPGPNPTVIPTITPPLEFIQPTTIGTVSPASSPTAIPMQSSATPQSPQQAIQGQAALVIEALKNKDMASLSHFIHPVEGLRFSPYAYVKDTDLVFSADHVAGLMNDTTIYDWGAFESSGAPLELSFSDYYSKFVYDVDFASAPQISVNHRLGVSTSLDNSAEFYSGAMIVEYYFPGFDPKLQGMDWRSLRLVFLQDNNAWYLVGIIHDQWTT